MNTITLPQMLGDPVVINYSERLDGDTVFSFTTQLRFVVHRQLLGTFTPMVMDVLTTWALPETPPEGYLDQTELTVALALAKVATPFVSGALFVDDASPFLVELLKGPESGFNRQTLRESITEEVDAGNFWVSTDYIPTLTKQSQVVAVYKVSNPEHGSMLSPVNICRFLTERTASASGARCLQAEILAGYGVTVE